MTPTAAGVVTLTLPTATDTHALGMRIGAAAQPGDLVLLAGVLGAGKTVLAQGVGAGLGVHRGVVSPTFVLARVHTGGRLPLIHVDAYRLGGPDELDDLDLDTDLPRSLTVVEWGQGLAERLAAEHLLVALDRAADDVRTVRLSAVGPSWVSRLPLLRD